MKLLGNIAGYIFAGLAFTLAIPLIILYSIHGIAVAVSIMVTDGIRDKG